MGGTGMCASAHKFSILVRLRGDQVPIFKTDCQSSMKGIKQSCFKPKTPHPLQLINISADVGQDRARIRPGV